MITPIYACLIAILFVALAVNVIRYRRINKISLGDAEDKTLQRRIRAHANLTEWAPIVLFLILMVELQDAPGWLVHLCGLMLLIGRATHAYALTYPKHTANGFRVIGMVLTFMPITISVLANLYLALF